MDKPNMEILRVLYFHRKHILLVTLIASLFTYGVTFLLKPKYRSVAYVYPANMVPIFMEQQNKSVSHTELLLQFCNSNDVRQNVLRRFRLYKHYGLDTNDTQFKHWFNVIYDENVRVSQTRYESVELSVLDTDPDSAQKIAQGIIDAVNKTIAEQHLNKFNEYVAMNKGYLLTHRRALDSLQQCMEAFTKQYGLVDIGAQMREASKNYYKLLSEGKESTKLTEAMESIEEHGPQFYRLSSALQEEGRMYATVENELTQAIRDFKRSLTYMIVPSRPTRPDIKYWPKRGLITTVAGISSFVLACLYFAYASRLKEVLINIKTPPALSK